MATMDLREVLYISAEVTIGLITVVGNLIVLIAILTNRKLHTITNVFVSNLAVADIAVGVFVAPCAALSFLGVPRNKLGCIFINCAILMFTNISILMLLTIAVERFVAIRFPFLYERHMTVKMALCTNFSIWIIGSLLGLLPLFGWNISPDEISFCAFTQVISMEYMVYFQFFGLIIIPLFLMLCIYLYILLIVRKQIKRTRTLQNLFQGENNAKRDKRWNKDVQAAKMFALLFFLFGAFWLPVNILNSITLFCPSCVTPYELLLTAIVLSHANSSINPFLYAASNSRIKTAIKVMFRLKLGEEEMRTSTDGKSINGRNCNHVDAIPSTGHANGGANRLHTNGKAVSGEKVDGIDGPTFIQETKRGEESGVDPPYAPKPETHSESRSVSEAENLDCAPGTNREENSRLNINSSFSTTGDLPCKNKNHYNQIQTHSLRGEKEEIETITPLEGIFNSVGNGDLNLGVIGLTSDEEKPQIDSFALSRPSTLSLQPDEALKGEQKNGHLSTDSPILGTSRSNGHINYGFVIETSEKADGSIGAYVNNKKENLPKHDDALSRHPASYYSTLTNSGTDNSLHTCELQKTDSHLQHRHSVYSQDSIHPPSPCQTLNQVGDGPRNISPTPPTTQLHADTSLVDAVTNPSRGTDHSAQHPLPCQLLSLSLSGRDSNITSNAHHNKVVIESEMDDLTGVEIYPESQARLKTHGSDPDTAPCLGESGVVYSSAVERTRL